MYLQTGFPYLYISIYRYSPGAGQKTPEIFVSGSSNKKWRHIRFKLGRAARFTKRKNGVSICQDFLLFATHQARFLSHWGWEDVADTSFDFEIKTFGKRQHFIIVLKENNWELSVIEWRILHICETDVVPTFGCCCSWLSDNTKWNSAWC